jgi:hypothetical protein
MIQRTCWRIIPTTLVVAGLVACGGGSNKTTAGSTLGTAASASSPAASASTATGARSAWATDVCGIVDQGTVSGLLDNAITAAASPPTQKYLCEYSGTLPNETSPVVLVQVHYYPNRSEWDIHMGNQPVKAKDHIADLGADAFKSSTGVWVLLDDGRLIITDVSYGVKDEAAKELALTKEILTHT